LSWLLRSHSPRAATAAAGRKKIDRIAGGFETSREEVEAKRHAIQDIRARECK
jgi:hypothetical protein